MSDKLRVGFVGCGKHATRNLYASLKFAPLNLVSVCDANEQLAKENVRNFGALRTYTDYKEMFDKEQLDAVIICIKPELHTWISIEALNRGLHVLVEKPVARNIADAQKIVQASKKNNKHVMPAFMKRFGTCYRMAKNLIEKSGDFGKPNLFDGKMGCVKFYEGNPLFFLLDFHLHIFDLARYYMGDVESVFAYPMKKHEWATGYAISIKFKSGAIGTITGANTQGFGQHWERVEINGDERQVVIDNVAHIRYHRDTHKTLEWRKEPELLFDKDVLEWQVAHTQSINEYNSYFTNGYAWEIKHFAEKLLNNETPEVTIADGLEATKIAYCVFESGRTGKPISIDGPEQQKLVDYDFNWPF